MVRSSEPLFSFFLKARRGRADVGDVVTEALSTDVGDAFTEAVGIDVVDAANESVVANGKRAVGVAIWS